MTRFPTLPLLFCLAACGSWPNLPETASQDRAAAWPELRPLSELLAPVEDGEASAEAADQLAARAGDLRRRAAILRSPVTDDAAFEALRARLDG